MPLTKLIAARKQEIEAFLDDDGLGALYLGVDPEVEPMLVKLLGAIDAGPRSPDVFIPIERPFTDPAAWCAGAHAALAEACDAVREDLAGELTLDLPPWQPAPGAFEAELAACARSLATSLRPRADHLVLVIGPSTGFEAPGYADCLRRLVDAVGLGPVKLIVLGPRGRSPLGSPKALRQASFHVSPEAIEGGIEDKLKDPGIPPLERLRYVSALSAFAASRRDFAVARPLAEQALGQARALGDPREEAAASFHLGNTHFREGAWEEARRWYEGAVELALAHDMHPITIQGLSHIGDTWVETTPVEHAVAYYEGALRFSRATGDAFSEAYVLDRLGLAHQRDGRPAEAGQAFREALALYRRMDPSLAQAARAGEAQTLERLSALPEAHRGADAEGDDLPEGGGHGR